jgi:Spy/CpxP family protein refolding chaperone
MEQIGSAEGFDDEKVEAVTDLVGKTVQAIQKLEDDYVHK